MSVTTTTARAKVAAATTPTIYNLAMPTAGTEYSQELSKGTKKILVRARLKSRAQIAFVSGDTATLFFTLEPGAVFFEENLDLSDAIIYVQSTAANQVMEILEWT